MNKSLVTGGAGFIGSHVVDELVNMNHQVVVLDNLSGGFIENLNPEAEFVDGDIVDNTLIGNIFQEYCFDYVFHLAAYAAEGLSQFIKRYNYANNLIGSVNLINSSINSNTVRCFVFTSSIAVYGSNQLPMIEEMKPAPEDSYGIAKYAIEQELDVSHQLFGLPYIIFRPHNVYGERQNIGDPYRNVLGIFMNQAMLGEPFSIYGDGTQTRAFSHIDDVAPIIARSIDFPDAYNQIYNVGADIPYSINELAGHVADAMGVELRIKYLDSRHEVLHAYSSHTKARNTFKGLFKDITLDVGIKRMADWAKKHGSQETKPFTNIEVTKNLPASWSTFLEEA